MNFTRKKGLGSRHELKRFHYGSTGSTGLSSLVIIFLFKKSSIHAPAFPGLCHNTVFLTSQEALLEKVVLY